MLRYVDAVEFNAFSAHAFEFLRDKLKLDINFPPDFFEGTELDQKPNHFSIEQAYRSNLPTGVFILRISSGLRLSKPVIIWETIVRSTGSEFQAIPDGINPESDTPEQIEWEDVAKTGERVLALLPIRPVTAIVVTQDCDCVRSQDISLCEIRDFKAVEGCAKDTKSVKGWVSILTQHSRLNLKWFYLPPDEKTGLACKSAVDFSVTMSVQRVDLKNALQLRKARLNTLADEHFRERISEYFRRYPYDEWYPLNAEELSEYKKTHQEAEPFPWQGSS